MTREELLRSREFWVVQIQNSLYRIIEEFRVKKKLTRSGLAEKFGVSKGYISQVLSGDFDHKISKLVDLSLASSKAPIMTFKDLDEYIKEDSERKTETTIGLPRILEYCITIDKKTTALRPETVHEIRTIVEKETLLSILPSVKVADSSQSTKISTVNLAGILS